MCEVGGVLDMPSIFDMKRSFDKQSMIVYYFNKWGQIILSHVEHVDTFK